MKGLRENQFDSNDQANNPVDFDSSQIETSGETVEDIKDKIGRRVMEILEQLSMESDQAEITRLQKELKQEMEKAKMPPVWKQLVLGEKMTA